MALIALNESNYEQHVSGKGIVVVDCWAAWCAACKDFTPIYERVAATFPAHTFGKLDTQVEKNLVSKLGIENIPTLLLYREGILLFKQPGYYDEAQLEDILRQAESLDMDVVRADIAAGKESRPSDSQ
jgi:thioredoxin 1